jgi:hypothetical protein
MSGADQGDRAHWSREQFQSVHNAGHNQFQQGDLSWIEARAFNDLALRSLPPGHELAVAIREGLAALSPRLPATQGLVRMPDPLRAVQCGQAQLRFRPDGALGKLLLGGGDWAADAAPLMALTYVTYRCCTHCSPCTAARGLLTGLRCSPLDCLTHAASKSTGTLART